MGNSTLGTTSRATCMVMVKGTRTRAPELCVFRPQKLAEQQRPELASEPKERLTVHEHQPEMPELDHLTLRPLGKEVSDFELCMPSL